MRHGMRVVRSANSGPLYSRFVAIREFSGIAARTQFTLSFEPILFRRSLWTSSIDPPLIRPIRDLALIGRRRRGWFHCFHCRYASALRPIVGGRFPFQNDISFLEVDFSFVIDQCVFGDHRCNQKSDPSDTGGMYGDALRTILQVVGSV